VTDEAPKFSPEEQAAIDAQIKEIEAIEAKGKLHPIQRQLFSLALKEDGVTWLKELPEGGEKEIWSILSAYKGDELGWAVFTMLRVSAYMDETLKLGKIAYQILSIANDAVIKWDLVKTVTGTDKDAAKKEAALREKTGGEKMAQPKMVGDAAPEGTLRVDQITPGGKRRL